MAKIATLTDAFPGTALAAQWSAFGPNAPVIGGGQLTLSSSAASAASSGITSNAAYDLTGSALFARLVSAGAEYPTTQAVLMAQDSGGNVVEILAGNGQLLAQHAIAWAYSAVGAPAAYDPAAMAWLRLREAAGTVYYEYSADAASWTVLASEPDPADLTSVTAILQQGQYGGTDPAASSAWASVNLAPALIPARRVARAGSGPGALRPAAAGDLLPLPPPGGAYLRVVNSSGGPVVVTLTPPPGGGPLQTTIAPWPVTVPDGGDVARGPFPPWVFAWPDGTCPVTYSAVAGVAVEALLTPGW